VDPRLDQLFGFLAEVDFAGYSPVYADLARRCAGDSDIHEFINSAMAPNSRRGRMPVLFFAATHDIVLQQPDSTLAAIYRGEINEDPWPHFRQLLDDHRDELTKTFATRSVQTNEVGRSAAFLAGLSFLNADRPIAIVEIGTSAGLNQALDQFCVHYEFGDNEAFVVGPAQSPVQIHSEIRSEHFPLPSPFSIASKIGIDVNPIDIRSEEERRWLRACIWPGQAQRLQLLNAAIEIAQHTPPQFVVGDASEQTRAVIDSLPNDVLPVVLSSWVLAYFSAEQRQRFISSLDGIDVLTFEEISYTPWIDGPEESFTHVEQGGTVTTLGLRSRDGSNHALAVGHPHGRWLNWL